MRIEELLDRLDDVKPAGDLRWMARCPAHDDRTPSLSVGVGDEDRLLLKCHADCSIDEVTAAIGISAGDLFEKRSGGKEIVATYPYTDEHGKLLFEVVRFAPKDFRQRRPDGSGGWDWRLSGTRRVLYRLPKVIAAARRGERVFVVEGEKDVATLEGKGNVATTAPQGAGKWRAEYNDALRGAEVVVIADADEPGRAHARKVAVSVQACAKSVRVLEPTKGKDITAHIAAGGTFDDLAHLGDGPGGRTAVGRRLQASPMSSVRPTRTRWVWKDRIPCGAISILAGRPGLGKSTLLARLAAELSHGRLPGDLAGRPATTLMVSYEDSTDATIAPRLIAAEADLDRVFSLDMVDGDHADLISFPDDGEMIAELAKQHRASMLTIDPIMAALPSGIDSHRDQDVRRGLAPLRKLAEETGMAVLVVQHLRKGNAPDSLDRISGSVGFGAAARSVLGFGREEDEEDGPGRVVAQVKTNLSRLAPAVAATIEPMVISFDGLEIPTSSLLLGEEVDVRADELFSHSGGESRTEIEVACEWLYDFLGDGQWRESAAVREAAKKAQISISTLGRASNRLKVEKERHGMPSTTRWRLTDSQLTSPESTGEFAGGVTGANGSGEPIRSILESQSTQVTLDDLTGRRCSSPAELMAAELGVEL